MLDRFLALNAAAALDGPEGQALLSGELEDMSAPSMGPLPASDRILMLVDGTAVARFPAQGDDQPDFYLYLHHDEAGWTVSAFRTLSLMGIPRDLRHHLRQAPLRTGEQEKMLRNLELTLRSDRGLAAWFQQNRPGLERLRELAQAGEEATGELDLRVETPEASALLRSLDALLLTISRQGVIRVTIGGMVGNNVGFLFSEDPANVPPIDPNDHIWIEPVGDGWYLFKTT